MRFSKMLIRFKSKKIIIPVVTLIVIVGMVVYFSDWLTLFFLVKTEYSKAKMPGLYLTPISRELRLSNEKFSKQYLLSYENLTLKIPWNLKERIDSDYSKFYVFLNKKGIVISKKGKDESFRQKLLDEDSFEVQKSKFLFGEESLKSEYAFTSLILHTTPEQFSFFRPLPENARMIPLLMLKGIYTVYGNVMYKFSLENSRCFQFGDPQPTQIVHVFVFNDKDQVFRVDFCSATQAEIDYILSTIEFL